MAHVIGVADEVEAFVRPFSEGRLYRFTFRAFTAEGAFQPVEGHVGQQRRDYSSYTKDNFEFRRVISFQRSPYKR